jgi:hypothetical protein
MQKTFNFFYAFLLALVGIGATLMAEDITLTTYYPAPYGAYENLTTTNDTYLAMKSGESVGIGIPSLTVGIPTALNSTLEVAGNVVIAPYVAGRVAPADGLWVEGETNLEGPIIIRGNTVTGLYNSSLLVYGRVDLLPNAKTGYNGYLYADKVHSNTEYSTGPQATPSFGVALKTITIFDTVMGVNRVITVTNGIITDVAP